MSNVISVDSFLTIGNSHDVCEDYIIHGMEPTPYIILADGCSSSKDTDVGARLLAHSAKEILVRHLRQNEHIDREVLGKMAINNAENVARGLNLHNTCLDATLIVMFISENRVIVYFYGDGNLVRIKNTSGTNYHNYEYEKNMPYYLSYGINVERQKEYDKIMSVIDNGTLYHKWITKKADHKPDDEIQLRMDVHDYYHPMIYNFDINDHDIIAIMSDGVESFFNPVDGEKIHRNDVIDQFTSFKNTNGEFAKRRCRKALKEFHKEGIEHYDDISFGAFIIKN